MGSQYKQEDSYESGDVVSARLFFTDGTGTKVRPALILATPYVSRYILCQITSRHRAGSHYQIPLKPDELSGGSLNKDSFIDVSDLITVSDDVIYKKLGSLSYFKLKQVRDIVYNIIMGE
jgi:hypothetical protein